MVWQVHIGASQLELEYDGAAAPSPMLRVRLGPGAQAGGDGGSDPTACKLDVALPFAVDELSLKSRLKKKTGRLTISAHRA